MTIQEAYTQIVEYNKTFGENWVNPKMTDKDTEYKYFTIQIDDFTDLKETVDVDIFGVQKSKGKYYLHCKVVHTQFSRVYSIFDKSVLKKL